MAVLGNKAPQSTNATQGYQHPTKGKIVEPTRQSVENPPTVDRLKIAVCRQCRKYHPGPLFSCPGGEWTDMSGKTQTIIDPDQWHHCAEYERN